MIAVVDLGLGNLSSVKWALERVGGDATVTADPAVVRSAQALVLPGVGHYAAGARRLAETGLDQAIWDQATRVPILGICLGMQLLFAGSEEGGRGLGLLPGFVRALHRDGMPLPHMGWNQVRVRAAAGPLNAAGDGDAYFCHSYVVEPSESLLAMAFTDYGGEFVSAVQRQLITGVQFHPEKSGGYGRQLLAAFVEEVALCFR